MAPIISADFLVLPISFKTKREEESRFKKREAYYSYILNPEQRVKKIKAQTFTLNDSFSHLLFGERMREISALNSDWDGYGAIKPFESILIKTKAFIKILPNRFRENLDCEYIFPNPNGTVSIEWRDKKNVVSIEIGLSSSNFYSIINGMTDSEEKITDIVNCLPQKLIDSLNKFFV